MKSLALAALALSLAGPAAAAEVHAGDLVIRDAVMRAVPKGVPNTAAYVTIVNGGAKSDRLVSASCACAAHIEAHLSHVMAGQAMMMPAGPVEIPAGGTVRFAPGGYHLMVTGLKAPLADGGAQELVLRFQRAGEVKVAFDTRFRLDAR